MRKGWCEFLYSLLVHGEHFFLELEDCFGFGDVCLLAEEGDYAVDVGVVVLDDLCVF